MADTWIGVIDSRPTPLLNSLEASIENGSTSDNILVFVPKNDEEAVKFIKKFVKRVCQEYEIEPDIGFTTTPSISKPQEVSQHIVKKSGLEVMNTRKPLASPAGPDSSTPV